jgi:hypothetical protein
MKLLSMARAAVLLTAGMLPLHAFSWGGVASGKIAEIHATGGGNLPFRVYLTGAPVLCTNGMAEGYLDDTDPNYKVYVAALMMAKLTGATVTLYSDVGLFNRCRIGYVVVS